MSLRDSFLQAEPAGEVFESGGFRVFVRGMSVATRDKVQAAVGAAMPWRGIVLHACMFDPETKAPIFQPGDDPGSLDAGTMEPFIDKALELSAASDADREELAGN